MADYLTADQKALDVTQRSAAYYSEWCVVKLSRGQVHVQYTEVHLRLCCPLQASIVNLCHESGGTG